MDSVQDFASREVRQAFQEARQGFLPVSFRPPGIVWADGASTLDFLHRMSTNEMLDLPAGQARGTVLTTAIGRTVAVADVLHGADHVWIVAGHGQAETVRAWLSRHIFFQDDIRLSLPEQTFHRWMLVGPAAAGAVAGFFGQSPPTGSEILTVDNDRAWRVHRPIPGLALLLDDAGQARAESLWGPRGEGTPARQVFDALRIEAGAVWPEADVDSETIPLEAGLWDLVSFHKGCYIGQEVIARMESRNRLARRMAGLKLETPMEAPQEILRGGTTVGRLTSASVSPTLGPIGLALIRSAVADEAPTEVSLSPSGGTGTVLPLPLSPESR